MVKEGSAWEGIEAEKAKERMIKASHPKIDNNVARINLPHPELKEKKSMNFYIQKQKLGNLKH